MSVRPVVLLLWSLALPGCVSPHLVVNATAEKPTAKKPAEPTAQFGEYISAPGQVVPLHGQDLPRTDVAGHTFWPDKVKADAPTETLIQPQAYTPKKSEPFKLTSLPSESPIVAALRAYLDGRTDIAAQKLQSLDPANQQIIMTMLPAVATAGRADLTGKVPNDMAMLNGQMQSAADATAKLAPLTIRKACFVWRVSQFGVYEPVPEKHVFLPGSASVLYLELQNAPCQATPLPAGGPGFVTRLECSLQLQSADGKAVGALKTFPYAEYTRSAVRDYFLKVEFDVPNAAGPYSLVVEVRDPATGRKTKQAVELTVGR